MAIQVLEMPLNLVAGKSLPVLHISQGSYGEVRIKFNLYNDSTPYTLTDDITSIICNGCSATGAVFSYSCSYAVGNPYCTITVRNRMTQAAGHTVCELVLATATGVVGSCNFLIDVESSPYTDASVSTSDMATITESLTNAQAQALLSRSWAVGGTGSRSGENTNNSKYWAEQAAEVVGTVDDRLEEILSGVTSDSEILDARTGYNGLTYTTLGQAIREQCEGLSDRIDSVDGNTTFIAPEWTGDDHVNGDLVTNVDSGLVNTHLYQCYTAQTSGDDFTYADWRVTTIAAVIKYLIGDFAPLFSDTQLYNVGDIVMYNNRLRECTVAVTSPGAFSNTNWTVHSVSYWLQYILPTKRSVDALSASVPNISELAQDAFDRWVASVPVWSSMMPYTKGDLVFYDDGTGKYLYECIVNLATEGSFIDSEWQYRYNLGAVIKENTDFKYGIAEPFYTSFAYSNGSLVWHDDHLYRCTAVTSSTSPYIPTEWDSDYWQRTTVSTELARLRHSIAELS